MINLLPPHARKQVQIEYWVRVSSVWVVLLSLSFIIIGLLLVPALILVQSQLSIYGGEYKNVSSQNDLFKSLEEDVHLANAISEQLVNTGTEPLFSKLISEVESIASRSVVLNSISFSRTGGIVESIQIRGEASSRSLLVQFRDDLKRSPLFESAELPLSNLAKDVDVPFNITVIVNNMSEE